MNCCDLPALMSHTGQLLQAVSLQATVHIGEARMHGCHAAHYEPILLCHTWTSCCRH